MKENRKTWKVVVCGTGFGTFYMEAIKSKYPHFELVGLVARGSERSIKCANHYGIPLYHSVEEVPQDIDLACVVIRSSSLGGIGTDMSIAFLERGIHVILEQPVHYEDLKECTKVAMKNKCCFMTGDLYLNTPEIRRFIQMCEFLKKQGEEIEFLKIASCVQAFYPFVEILQQLFPGVKVDCDYVGPQVGNFKQVTGKIGKIPFSFQYNNTMNPLDPDNHMQLLHSFCVYYQSGRLELVDTRGPLIWYPRLNMPWSVLDEGGLPEKYPDHMNLSCVQVITPDINQLDKPYYEFVEKAWIKDIGRDLDKIYEMNQNKKLFLIKAQQEYKSSKQWNDLTQKLGYASLDATLDPKPLINQEIRVAGILPEEKCNENR